MRMMEAIHKYPRTAHLEGSRLQPGDEDLESHPLAALAGRPLVIEEKLDGANAALSFDQTGALRLQSRGHYLVGGGRERHFDLFKTWGAALAPRLLPVLGWRYVVYGEWLYAKHTVFYDRLPHYFLEFDVLDRETGSFLSTPRRRHLLAGLPLVSVPVLHQGPLAEPGGLPGMVGPSGFIAPGHTGRLEALARELGQRPAEALRQTDPSTAMEGLYVKVEEDGRVTERFKWVRRGFLQVVLESDGHWQSRPILPNQLAPGVDLFAGLA